MMEGVFSWVIYFSLIAACKCNLHKPTMPFPVWL
jgi:hypothetical protein